MTHTPTFRQPHPRAGIYPLRVGIPLAPSEVEGSQEPESVVVGRFEVHSR